MILKVLLKPLSAHIREKCFTLATGEIARWTFRISHFPTTRRKSSSTSGVVTAAVCILVYTFPLSIHTYHAKQAQHIYNQSTYKYINNILYRLDATTSWSILRGMLGRLLRAHRELIQLYRYICCCSLVFPLKAQMYGWNCVPQYYGIHAEARPPARACYVVYLANNFPHYICECGVSICKVYVLDCWWH